LRHADGKCGKRQRHRVAFMSFGFRFRGLLYAPVVAM
jgi:hypothetical protein